VSAVGAGTVTVTVNGQPLVLKLPAGLTLPASLVGSQVTFDLTFANGRVVADDDDRDDDEDRSGTTTTPTTTTTTTSGRDVHHGHGRGGGHDG
jgi:hypothetical protein